MLSTIVATRQRSLSRNSSKNFFPYKRAPLHAFTQGLLSILTKKQQFSLSIVVDSK